jgi:hypothetical protein
MWKDPILLANTDGIRGFCFDEKARAVHELCWS